MTKPNVHRAAARRPMARLLTPLVITAVILVLAWREAKLIHQTTTVGGGGEQQAILRAATLLTNPPAADASSTVALTAERISISGGGGRGQSNVPTYGLMNSTSGGTSTATSTSTDVILFIFCPSGNESVRFTEQAVLSARTAGWSRRHIVLLDASYNGHCSTGSDFLRHETGYIHRSVPFDVTFAQLQNSAWMLAKEWGFPFYFWQHADVVITSSEGEERDFATKALEAVNEAPPNWGVILFAYDWFAAYRTEVVEAVRWDHGIPHYYADCDFYARIYLAGYGIENKLAGAVLHLKTLLSEDEAQTAKREMQGYSLGWWRRHGAFETKGTRISREKQRTIKAAGKVTVSGLKSKVKVDVIGVKDLSSNASIIRYEEQAKAGRSYFQKKWGSLDLCDWRRDNMPLFDINTAVGKQ